MPKNILIFAPAGAWMVHHQVDALIGGALQERGCAVQVLGCDRLLHQCEVQSCKTDSIACEACEQNSRHWFAQFKLAITWMGDLVSREDLASIEQWAGEQDCLQFKNIHFRDLPLGAWMTHTLHADLKTGELDFNLTPVVARARVQLRNAAVVALATLRAVERFTPDFVLCYSGANSIYRVFFEICRSRHIHGICHERGYQQGCFMLARDLSVYDLYAQNPPEWEVHRQCPLAEKEYRALEAIFDARASGGNTNFQRYHSFTEEGAAIWRRLRLTPERKTIIALTSGDWEYGMLVNHGQMHYVWQNQIDWLDETVAICSREGWNLVIRIHPLSAGTTTYPRADRFLCRLMERLPAWGDSVRVVFPAENLSTYDLMTVADGIATVFSTASAEAMLRGMPVLCVAECRFQAMGMRRLADRESYRDELAMLLNTKPCANLETLRLACRHAAFLFLRVAALQFERIGIKDIYHHDIRLPMAGEALGGTDEVLDRVCRCVLEGGSLYVAPDADGSLEQETQLLSHRLTALQAMREAGRIPSAHQAARGVVNVIRQASEHVQEPTIAPVGWRSRHQEARFTTLRLNASGGAHAMHKTLCHVAQTGEDPFIYFLPDNVVLDESAISQAVDALEAPENGPRTGVLFGCYLVHDEGDALTLGQEWNTTTHPPDAAQLPPPAIPPLTEPMNVLGLVVWRREKLAAWADLELTKQDNDATWCRDMLASFLDSERFLNLAEPVMVIRAGESQEQIFNRADALSKQGDIEGALKEAVICQERFGFTNGLRGRMASWLCQHQRHAQAVAMLYEEYRSGTPGQECWGMLRSALPLITIKGPRYKDHASAVETVFGYMVPGQEQYLHEKVLSLPQDARILEIGALHGRSTVAMAFACVGTRRNILTIDTFCGNEGLMGRTSWFYNQWRGNLRRWGLEAYVTARPGFSHPVVRSLDPDDMFDFVFIDASHEYKDVLLDFELVWPHVKTGGWIGFHDVEPSWPGCWRVWEQTGKRLLTNHEVCSTLACGQKESGTLWKTHEDEWPGHTISVARHLASTDDQREIGNAMLTLMRGESDATIKATIASAPDSLRQHFINAIAEAGDDPWLHQMLSLMLTASDPAAARHHGEQAARLGL